MTHSRHAAQAMIDEAAAALRTSRIGQTIRAYETVTSTNALALSWAGEGAPDGAVVYADFQEQGRGRLGRRWSADAGLNLMFSVVLRPELPPDRLGLVTIAACVAVAEAIESYVAPVRPQIKWPNDVLVEGKKCCGMLLETNWPSGRTDRVPAVVLGVGLNVNQTEFTGELDGRATSLLLSTGRRMNRSEVLTDLFDSLESTLDMLPDEEALVRRHYMSRMRDLNEPIELQFAEEGGSVFGIAAGLHESGGLMLSTDEGMRVFHAGEVTRSS